jgi:hemerythrin-like domain-containing protein
MLVCHHGKEEEVLFPTLELNGMPRQGGPIARMIFEHGVAKELATKMESSATDYLSTGKSSALIADIRNYVDHVSSHLAKENLRLFAMADMILTATASELDKNLAVSEQAKLTDLGKDRKHYEDLVTGIESELVQT